jgi:hypothetical protein
MEWKSQAKRSVAAGILALGLLAVSDPIAAADSSGQMVVGITILPVCSIATDATRGTTGRASPAVTVRCAKGASYELDVVPPALQAVPGPAGITWVTIDF